jgi:hypothetical protein
MLPRQGHGCHTRRGLGGDPAIGRADFSWAAKSDDEIQSFVEQEVHGRLTAFQDKESGSKKFMFGNSVFGLASEPRENQIEKGLAYYFGERDRQRKIFEQIQDLVAKRKSHG